MIALLDVQYDDARARVAAVLADAWTDATPRDERVKVVPVAGAYAPGRFYLRELPPLLSMLADLPPPSIIIIDAFVWLADARPGLGARLHDAVKLPVVGIAKTAFRGAPAVEVLRGASRKPLLVTATGIDPHVAADRVRAMHGPYRLPTLVARADALARGR